MKQHKIFPSSVLATATLSKATLSKAALFKAALFKAALSKAALFKAALSKAVLSKAALFKAVFSKSVLSAAAVATVVLAASCSGAGSQEITGMFPDYSDATIPCNIAPLNFRLQGADRFDVAIQGAHGQYSFKGRKGLADFPEKRWHSMLNAEKGGTLQVTVTAKNSSQSQGSSQDNAQAAGGNWSRTFSLTVSADSIDPYLSYRLIEPAYEVWNDIQVEERSMESFKTRLLGDNRLTGKGCMNCHTSNRNGTSFMHLRGSNGGTIVNRNGQISKINTRTDHSGGGVYGDISQDGRYAVFTTADITFAIHNRLDLRMEVYDKRSDLVVIDLDNLTAQDSPAVSGSEYQETFPCFSADGRTIFFCRSVSHQQPDSIRDMHYDIAAVQFDPNTGAVGDRVATLIRGGENLSFSHLKASPDGHWLMATAAEYGTFPVWHQEAELWLIDLQEHTVNVMENANARGADTYHSWSSNSNWVVFASKRDDMIYGRPYIAHIAADGTIGKAFVLPQKDPVLYTNTMKSFNLPELYTSPEDYNARTVGSLSTIPTDQVSYIAR